ncbi:hypothetical protein ACKWTF_007141 [Chironomus riparius]
MSDDEISWRGSSLEEIFDGFEVFDDRNEAPNLDTSESHTILFETPLPDDENIQPIPLEGSDVWDDDHVKLPCNKESVYYEIGENESKIKKYRWDLIISSLKDKEIRTSLDLENCIKAYNTKYESTWNFKALHALFEDEFLEEETEYFFKVVLPKIIDLALSLPEIIKKPIPLLKQSMNHTISMSKKQAACLLANAFLCTFPNRNVPRKNTDYPEINFNRLFCLVGTSTVQKIKCICNYFRRIVVKSMSTGILTFQRRFIDPESLPKWEQSDLKFSSIKWHVDSYGRIEKGDGMLQMDFANRYLGGGALGHGCVQEEIRFMINPELIVGMLFCESMKSTEAILIYGTEQYSKYSGYSSSFSWEGNFEDDTPCDKFRRKAVHIAAIDALSFRNPYVQFDEKLLRRDVNKAYCGFYRDPSLESPGLPVATGNWGCGAFGGFNKLKCLVQMISCVANRRNLVYYTFGDEQLVEDMNNMFKFLSDNDVTIGQLWQYLASFKSQNKKFNEFYQYIYDQHDAENFLGELEEQTDTFDMSHEVHIERAVTEGAEKRRSYEEAYVETSNTIEISIHYPEVKEELENPSKRTRTEESDNISDLCEKLNEKIQDNHDNLIEEDYQEIILAVDEVHQEVSVSNEYTDQDAKSTKRDVDDCNNQDMESVNSQSHDDHNYQGPTETKEDLEKKEPPQRKTILDYFKPKTSNS